MRKRKIVKDMVPSARRLDELVEGATVDCYNEEEQASGFFTMIEENLALPLATRVLGVEASVVFIIHRDRRSLTSRCSSSSRPMSTARKCRVQRPIPI
jgi:hypothetical protein